MNDTHLKSPRTIWLVNSEPGVLQSLTLILRYGFPDVVLEDFAGAQAAWARLENSQPDLLITADAMPVMRGSELVERLHQRGDTFPIIVTSSWKLTRDLVDTYAAKGMNIQFMELPMDVRDLINMVHRTWGEALRP